MCIFRGHSQGEVRASTLCLQGAADSGPGAPQLCQVASQTRTCLLQAGLPGFYDPCVGEDKSLKVLYQFRGALHQVMAQDGAALRIPKQCE